MQTTFIMLDVWTEVKLHGNATHNHRFNANKTIRNPHVPIECICSFFLICVISFLLILLVHIEGPKTDKTASVLN